MTEPHVPVAIQPHVGRGWRFPPRWHEAGVELAVDDDVIRGAVLTLLRTAPGERRMRPTYGAGLDAHVFGPRTNETCAQLAFAVERALVRFEPRVIVDDVRARPGGANDRIEVEITFRTDRHRRPTSLVLPFSLEGRPS